MPTRTAVILMLDAVALILSTTAVFIPVTRTPFMHAAVFALTTGLTTEYFWRMRKHGLLGMTVAQIYASSDSRKPRTTFVSTAATVMGVVAMLIMST